MTKIISKKIDNIRREISFLFLNYDIGQNIDTIDTMSKNLDVGRGSIQTVITELEKSNTIKLKKSGSKGTTLIEKDMDSLLVLADKKKIYGCFPMPGNKTWNYEKLKQYMSYETRCDVNILFTNNTDACVEMLKDNWIKITLLSKLQANEIVKYNNDITLLGDIVDIAFDTNYVKVSHELKVKNIGVDLLNFSHRYLVESNYENNKGLKFINIPYNMLLTELSNGNIDSTIIDYRDINTFDYTLSQVKIPEELKIQTVLISKKVSFIKNSVVKNYVKDSIKLN